MKNAAAAPLTSASRGRFKAMKIIDKINEKIKAGGICTSFEFFPAKTEKGMNNLLTRIHNMRYKLLPTFVTLTWRSAFKDERLWIKIGRTIQLEFEIEVLMHLTCHLPVGDLKRILGNCRKAGLRNILALRGDPPIGQERWKKREGCLNNAKELVQLIRAEHGDYFCIAVAGYPEAHIETWNSQFLPPSKKSRAIDISRLKGKIDAGGDFIVSQFFFDAEKFMRHLQECKSSGITCPILPGYLPIQNYKSYKKFTSWCKTHVPEKVVEDLEMIKDNDQAVKAYGIQLGIKTFETLIAGGCKCVHFYTMNLAFAVSSILSGLHLVSNVRNLPWKLQGHREGVKEEVRPIFWAKRPLSYISRTRSWGEFPNGRWGDSASPAYGELTDYYLAFKRGQKKDDRLKNWGAPQTVTDVEAVFRQFVAGKVKQLPWVDEPIAEESSLITDQLEWVNANGFLTINSQPRVNAAPSDDPHVGWGGPGGYVFQKAYLEFFTSPELFKQLLLLFPQYPTLAYHAINQSGEEFSNVKATKEMKGEPVTAVTWGVFPGREVLQPTVVDHSSFRAWKSEAFELWLTHWASIYKQDTDEHRTSKKLINNIHDTYFLVNILDNDFQNADSDIFRIFKQLVVHRLSKPELQTYTDELEEKVRKLRKKLLKTQRQNMEQAKELKKSEEECAQAMSENRKLKAQMKYKVAVRSRSSS